MIALQDMMEENIISLNEINQVYLLVGKKIVFWFSHLRSKVFRENR